MDALAGSGKTFSAVVTDIPYGEVSQKSSGLRLLDRGDADRCSIGADELVAPCVPICSGSFYVFCGTEQISPLVSMFKAQGMTTRVGAWEKTNPSPMNGTRLWLSGLEFCVFARKSHATFNEHCKKALWQAPSGRSKIHPTQKPTSLIERLIIASTNPGETVLDFCAGSGTTAVAAESTGRKWVLIDKEEKYCEIIANRLGRQRRLKLSA